jgi:hypothetical protein
MQPENDAQAALHYLENCEYFEKAIKNAEPFPDATNDNLVVCALRCIHELRRRALKGEAVPMHLLTVAYVGAVQLNLIAEQKPDGVAKAAQKFTKYPLNVHPSWLKDKTAKNLLERLKVGQGTVFSLKSPASYADNPAKAWAFEAIRHIRRLQDALPQAQKADPTLKLTDIEKQALALPKLTRATVKQWGQCARQLYPKDIHKLQQWAFISEGHKEVYRTPAKKRHAIFLRIEQAMRSLVRQRQGV